jgi:hypothetical protein
LKSPARNPEYAALLARVQQGDPTVDFRAFRIAGARNSLANASQREEAERTAFNNLLTYGNFQGALDSANQALDRDYASLIGHFDAMIACQALQRVQEAAVHERLLNFFIASILKSGDGKDLQSAWFVVTLQEEDVFLYRVLGGTRKSRAFWQPTGHLYDCVDVVDSKNNPTRRVWFNADSALPWFKTLPSTPPRWINRPHP